MDILEKYVLLVDEYKLLTERNVIPKKRNNIKYFDYKELVLKITLLRKFMMQKEEMYIVNILDKIKELNREEDTIYQLEKEISDLFNLEVSYSLPNSEIQHLYHSVTDLIYGLYLHSDTEKIENAILSDENIRKQLLVNFIQKFDPIIYRTYELIKVNIVPNLIINESNQKAPIIHFSNKKNVTREVKRSPKWTNIDGHDIEKKFEQFIGELNDRDRKILSTADLFISLLKEKKVNSNKVSKLLTPQSPIYSNIERNSKIFKSINNHALSTRVRYSTDLKYAYVYFFGDVISPIALDGPQLLKNINCIRFKKQIFTGKYKINNFVNELPTYYMSTNQNKLK